ncbi:plasmid pRiA4b ORF-3 family protein [Haloglycomyces albus]|uniref:plasmid pRiA4b ORF-3 family protein n=1 Tax=Haloglycomyces albus TaxID=526067 RepID=UPI00046CCA28|nr:plasmid pRiA4b ORF-3 family protein [Haloglycomyces albus]
MQHQDLLGNLNVRQRVEVDETLELLDTELFEFLASESERLYREATAQSVASSIVSSDAFDSPYVIEHLMRHLESRPHPGTLALLRTLAAEDHAGIKTEAARSAERMAEQDVSAPSWVDTVSQHVEHVATYRGVSSADADEEWILSVFRHGDNLEAFLLEIDRLNCGEIAEVVPFSGDRAEEMRRTFLTGDFLENNPPLDVTEIDRDDAAFYLSSALDTMAAHSEEGAFADPGSEDAELELHELISLIGLLTNRLVKTRMLTIVESHGAHVDQPPEFGGAPRPLHTPNYGDITLEDESLLEKIFQVNVELAGTKPPVWRRLQVRGDTTLAELHRLLLAAFDWSGERKHVFHSISGEFCDPRYRLEFARDENAVTVANLVNQTGDDFTYVYDFADDWEHHIRVEKVHKPSGDVEYPCCSDGHGMSPLEGSGGVHTWRDVVSAWKHPKSPDNAEIVARLREALGDERADDFDPAEFSLEEVNDRIRSQFD